MGRFQYLLFVAICIGLLAIWCTADGSINLADGNSFGMTARAMAAPLDNLRGTPLLGHAANDSLVARETVRSDAQGASARGTDSPAATSMVRKKVATNSALSSRSTSVEISSSGPLIFYTDVTSGPNSGGERNDGSYLTIFGVHFGATQGTSTVTINGEPVAQYILWSDTKIGVQVGHVSSGPIVVSAGSFPSNSDKTFTVRSGHIYYIGPSIDNSAPKACPDLLSNNSYSTPWGLTNYASTTESNYNPSIMRTPYTYYSCISPGDTLVFLNGVNYPYFDGRGWHAALTPDKAGTTATSFVTIMARPGATATLGGEGWANDGIRNTGTSTYTVYSGLTLIGGTSDSGSALVPDQYDRFVGNIVECPNCGGSSGAMTGVSNDIALGNIIYNVSTDYKALPGGSNKQFHAVYFAGNNFEFAWNRIYDTGAYNGFQINEDGSPGFYNFSIHDNDIADVNGSGINLSDIDPSSGYVLVYNNIIHHVGVSIANDGSEGDPHSCIAVKGYGSATGAGTAKIYNNTMYDCSSYLNKNPVSSASCAILTSANQLNVTTELVNNIVYQPAYAGTSRQNVFICGGSPVGTLTGSNNLWYSQTSPRTSASVTRIGTIANPMFVSATDFHLQTASPAIGGGIPFGGLTRDVDGMIRAKPPTIGAYEYSKSDSAASTPVPGGTEATYAAAPLVTPKRIIFVSMVLVALILIFIAWNSHSFRMAGWRKRAS